MDKCVNRRDETLAFFGIRNRLVNRLRSDLKIFCEINDRSSRKLNSPSKFSAFIFGISRFWHRFTVLSQIVPRTCDLCKRKYNNCWGRELRLRSEIAASHNWKLRKSSESLKMALLTT